MPHRRVFYLLIILGAHIPWLAIVYPGRPYIIDILAQLWMFILPIWILATVAGFVAKKRMLAWNLVVACAFTLVAALTFRVPVGHPVDAERSYMDIKVATFNAGGWNRSSAAQLVRWVAAEEPDILLITEIGGSIYLDRPIDALFPHVVRGHEPSLAYSRFPLERLAGWRADPYGPDHIVDMRPVVASLPTGEQLLVIGLHPMSPRTPGRWTRALNMVENGWQKLREYPEVSEMVTIVAGDFNSTPVGRVYQTIVRVSGLVDACPRWWRDGTFPADVPALLQIPIDHILVDRRIRVDAYRVGPHLGSDHRPVIATLRIPTRTE